jgi:hypothetical protein
MISTKPDNCYFYNLKIRGGILYEEDSAIIILCYGFTDWLNWFCAVFLVRE